MKTKIKLFIINLFGIVRKGQIWEYTRNAKNPFEKKTILRRKVLEVKNGYVKYLDLQYSEIFSEKIDWFTACFKCVNL